jgi:hypothetical protein
MPLSASFPIHKPRTAVTARGYRLPQMAWPSENYYPLVLSSETAPSYQLIANSFPFVQLIPALIGT